MRSFRHVVSLVAGLTLCTTIAAGQGIPTEQANYLTIFREQVKPGHSGDHAATEAGWPIALAKSGSQQTYLALSAMTGAPEVLFVQPMASYAAAAAEMKRGDADPVLTAELARLSKADGEHLSGASTLLLRGRKDLSHGAYPDMAMQRFFDITTFRMKPGHEASFEAAAKAYNALVDRAGTGTGYRVYQVIAGAQDPTFMIFSSVASYADLDQSDADGGKIWGLRNEGDKAVFAQFSEDLVFSMTNRYSLDAKMSFVPAEMRAKDPAFWSPAPTAAPKKKK
jgi:hypothetical protein